MNKKFKFVKEFRSSEGVIPVGSELTVMGSTILFNDYMLQPAYYEDFKNLIASEIDKPKYLKQIPFPTSMIGRNGRNMG